MRTAGGDSPAEGGSGPAGSSRSAVDQDQLARLFEDCRPQLVRVCRSILGKSDGAEDAVQETYLRASGNLSRFEAGNFAAWLSQIARRLCFDQIRARSPAQSRETDREPGTTWDEMRLMTGIQIRTILGGLPDPQRWCLKLFYIDGHSAKEVAKATGFTEKQVKSYLQNGRRNFMRQWDALQRKRHE